MKKFEKSIVKNQNNKGITLITLVVTIVVLLILSGIAINLTIGDNGILSKSASIARDANSAIEEAQKYINSQQEDTISEDGTQTGVVSTLSINDIKAKNNSEGTGIIVETDITGSNIVQIAYSIDDGATWEIPGNGLETTHEFLNIKAGEYKITVRVRDLNNEVIKSIVFTMTN